MGLNGRLRDRELMLMHIDALYAHDAQGRMLRINEPNGKTDVIPSVSEGPELHHSWPATDIAQ